MAAQIGRRNGPLPQSVTLEISLRYDSLLLEEFGNNPTEVKHWLSSVIQLAKPKMTLIDLRVHLKVVGTVEHFNRKIRATDAALREIAATENRGKRGPIAYFSAGNVALISHSFLFQAGALALLLLPLLAEHRELRSASTKRRRTSWRPPGSWHMSSDITSGCSEWKQT